MIVTSRDGLFQYQAPARFCEPAVLADEINRAPAKVQSALLEAVQERQVTLGDESTCVPILSSCWRHKTRSRRELTPLPGAKIGPDSC